MESIRRSRCQTFPGGYKQASSSVTPEHRTMNPWFMREEPGKQDQPPSKQSSSSACLLAGIYLFLQRRITDLRVAWAAPAAFRVAESRADITAGEVQDHPPTAGTFLTAYRACMPNLC